MGIKFFNKSIRNSIYCFVYFVDDIVDALYDYDKVFLYLFTTFQEDYYHACSNEIPINPIPNSFQITACKYNIDYERIKTLLKSMRSDLPKKEFNDDEVVEYIYVLLDAVGLMVHKVFVNGYNELTRNINIYTYKEFRIALEGIKKLPENSKNGMHVAYLYYIKLTSKIEDTPLEKLLNKRIRTPNWSKIWTLAFIRIGNKLKLA